MGASPLSVPVLRKCLDNLESRKKLVRLQPMAALGKDLRVKHTDLSREKFNGETAQEPES